MGSLSQVILMSALQVAGFQNSNIESKDKFYYSHEQSSDILKTLLPDQDYIIYEELLNPNSRYTWEQKEVHKSKLIEHLGKQLIEASNPWAK